MSAPPFVQPFFDSLGQQTPAPHAATVNAAARNRLERILTAPVEGPGRGILLRAPRAGYGKSHLLSQLQTRLATTHEFLPLVPQEGRKVDAAGAIEAALRRLTRQLPAGGGLTALDLQARRLLSAALQPLVNSGEVPCQDRESALAALRQRPVETFDFHHPQAVTAQWTKENFEVLGPRLSLELSHSTGCSLNETSFWLATLFRFAVATPEHPGRTGMIIQSAVSDAGVERYASLLALLSMNSRVVVVADDLEGMHADPGAALRFASFLATVRQEAPRVDVVVSLNDDVWQSAFEPALSGGLQDRLGEAEVRLEPLNEADVTALLEARAPGRVGALLGKLGLFPAERYARRVLRRLTEIEGESEAEREVAPAVLKEESSAQASSSAAPFADLMNVPAPSTEPEAPSQAPPAQPEPVGAEEPEGQAQPVEEIVVPTPDVEKSGAPSTSPFEVDTPVRPEAEAVAPVTPPPVPAQPPAAGSAVAGGESERIDDLLRQFRERYGRE